MNMILLLLKSESWIANMYLSVTFSTKILRYFFLAQRMSCLPCRIQASLLPVRSAPLTPHAILVSITRRLPKQQVAAVRPRRTGRDFDATFRAAWPILPWTSQAACGSSQTFFHQFSRYYVSRASLSGCVTCKTVIHTDFWNSFFLCVCALWEARTCSHQNRYDRGGYPFC